VYTAVFPEVVYVLDVFMKKSKSGVGTPRLSKNRVRARFDAARRHYEDNYRKRGERQ
jgi:phage-related protein